VSWRLVYTAQARRDAKKLARGGLKPEAQRLLELLAEDPLKSPPPYENLRGDLAGALTRRISLQHRLVYQVIQETRTIKVIRMWTHYE